MVELPPEQRFIPGTLLADRYEVVRFLSAGGMGSVVLVKDRNLQGAQLVLKFLHPSHSLDEQQFKRFQNEALLMRELNHPHIVRVFDFGDIGNGTFYLSMEYVSGMTLGQYIRGNNKELNFKRTLEILYQIAIALSFAHSKGIVHRDLKPDNVLIDDLGDVRITDFGLGKAMQADLSLTDTGQAVGTPQYMAPEQLRGEQAVAQTDIYAFGLLAYEIVTGKRAFNAESYLALATMHLKDPIPQFATKQSGIPRWFQDFVEMCSAKAIHKRFASFAEIAEVIASNIPATKRSLSLEPQVFGSSSSVQHWRVKWRMRQPKRIALAVISLVPLITAVIMVLVGRNNFEVRRYYGHYVYQAELALGYRAPALRWLFLGEHYPHIEPSKESLQHIIENEDHTIAETLLAAGVNPNVRTAEGLSMLQVAILQANGQAIDVLSEYGADFTVEDEMRRSPLILAASTGSTETIGSVLVHTPKVNFNIDARDIFQKTALHYATEQGNISGVELLLRWGASAHLRDQNGKSILMYASESGRADTSDRILTKTGSAGINLRDQDGFSALHYGVRSGSEEVVQLLLTYGADLQLLTADGRSVYELAMEAGNKELAARLKQMLAAKTEQGLG